MLPKDGGLFEERKASNLSKTRASPFDGSTYSTALSDSLNGG